MASDAGVRVAIVNGRDPDAVSKAIARKIGTYFPPKTKAKKRRPS
jgi:glutamate 5-kinase